MNTPDPSNLEVVRDPEREDEEEEDLWEGGGGEGEGRGRGGRERRSGGTGGEVEIGRSGERGDESQARRVERVSVGKGGGEK